MSIQRDAVTVYAYLTGAILPRSPQVPVTYGEIERDTGVEIGVEGRYMGQVLGVISRGCAHRRLPPLTAIVVGSGGIPGKGYFTELAMMERDGNLGGWRIDPGIDRWIRRPAPSGFDKDLDRWNYRPMIQDHQRSVWAWQEWPETL